MDLFTSTNYYFNPFAIPHFAVALFIVALIFFLLITEGRSFVCLSLLLMNTAFLLWMTNTGMMYCSANQETARFWLGLCYIGVSMIPASCLQFTFAVLGLYKHHRRTVQAAWFISIIFLILTASSDHFFIEIRQRWWGYYPLYGWHGTLFITFTISLFIYSFYHFTKEYLKAAPPSLQRARAKCCMVAFALGYIGAIDFIAKYGLDFYPGGYLPVTMLLMLVARTARRYRLDMTPGLAAPNIIETMSNALVILNDEGDIALTNKVAEDLFSTSKNSLDGKNLFTLTGWALFRDVRQLATECPIHLLPVTFSKSDGSTVYLELSISVRREHKLLFAFICLLQDVTQRTLAEKQLKQAHQELENKVEERTFDLQVANSNLKKEIEERTRMEDERTEIMVKSVSQSKLASLGEIATGIAHEINQPLTYINIVFQAIQRDLKECSLDPVELANDCEESIKQINRITTIINHLRTFGRNEEAAPFQKVNFMDVINNSMILMRERLRLKNISVSITVDEKLPMICGQPVRLEQVIINLFQNSIAALERQNDAEVGIKISRSINSIIIIFADNGAGVPAEFADKVFEPFFTSKEVGKGTGLGLSISYGIIADHQGKIELLPISPGWTTFRITIPTKGKC